MCRSQYPPNFSKKKKTVRREIRYLALTNSLLLISTRNDNISRGFATEGYADFGKSRGEGVIRKFPSVCVWGGGGGGIDIFWKYTMEFIPSFIFLICNGNRTESNSVCNHTCDNKIGRLRSGSLIWLSQV